MKPQNKHEIPNTVVPYGVDGEGNTRTVYDVDRGLACGLRCPICEGELVARQGEVNDWHLAHHYEQHGGGCGEGALHRLAKSVLSNAVGKHILLPHIHRLADRRATFHATALQRLKESPNYLIIRKTRLEYDVQRANRRVDCVLQGTVKTRQRATDGIKLPFEVGDAMIAVEINVSNPKDLQYRRDMQLAGADAFEIKISRQHVMQKLTPTVRNIEGVLRSIMLANSWGIKRWLNIPVPQPNVDCENPLNDLDSSEETPGSRVCSACQREYERRERMYR